MATTPALRSRVAGHDMMAAEAVYEWKRCLDPPKVQVHDREFRLCQWYGRRGESKKKEYSRECFKTRADAQAAAGAFRLKVEHKAKGGGGTVAAAKRARNADLNVPPPAAVAAAAPSPGDTPPPKKTATTRARAGAAPELAAAGHGGAGAGAGAASGSGSAGAGGGGAVRRRILSEFFHGDPSTAESTNVAGRASPPDAPVAGLARTYEHAVELQGRELAHYKELSMQPLEEETWSPVKTRGGRARGVQPGVAAGGDGQAGAQLARTSVQAGVAAGEGQPGALLGGVQTGAGAGGGRRASGGRAWQYARHVIHHKVHPPMLATSLTSPRHHLHTGTRHVIMHILNPRFVG
jgi:hypothetical protein